MIAAANDNALTAALRVALVPSPRLIIGGGPGTGKSTLARRLAAEHDLAVKETDDVIGAFDWSGASAEVARGFDTWTTPWVCCGIATSRATRKWLAAHPTGLPADHFVWLSIPREAQTAKQIACGRGCLTVWNEILPELRRRGAKIYTDTEGGPL